MTNTYNLYLLTKSKKYFIANNQIPYSKFPKPNWTFEGEQIQTNSPQEALQYFSSYNPYLFLITN
jgi:hypothetical protein